MQLMIRRYRPSDKDAVLTLFNAGVREHIRPCFYNAMTSPLYLAVTLALCVAGYLLGSMLGAVVLPGAWVGFIYYCCHALFAGFLRGGLRTDMQDIPRYYLSRPDDCFWVAEAEVDGRAQIMGTVAVVAQQSGKERYGELFRMVVSSSCRRVGLGSRMTQTVVDFCKERGFSKVVLLTTTAQAAGVALYKKRGFSLVHSHAKTHAPEWMVTLSKFLLVMQLVIRQYSPSDKDAVLTLFSVAVRENIQPCFYNAMTSPLYLAVTLALCVAGCLLGSMLGAVVLPGAWVGLVYYCCHEFYSSFVREKLRTDMQDIPRNYLSRPGDCFWVAEAEVDGRAQIMGAVAVVAKQSGKERYGELFRMVVSPSCRRVGLGSRMTQTVVDFCKERGFSKVVLETTTTQTAAVALYKKLGFRLVLSHTKTDDPEWMVKLCKFLLVMQLVIRRYRPSDKDAVLTLFSVAVREHIRPCFYNAMTSPLYLAVTLALCVAGCLLGSMLGAVVLPGAWVGLVYYCCHEYYSSLVREKLRTDMQDIPRYYLSRPDDCFWVAEAEVDGRAQIMGTVAVVAQQNGKERYGELFRMTVSPSCRRVGLGSRMTQTVVDFCKERGFSKVVLVTSSQTAAAALYEKLGFRLVLSHTKTHAPGWIVRLSNVTVLLMEKQL